MLRGFKYSPQTGNIYRNKRTGTRSPAGIIRSKKRGYIIFKFRNKQYSGHRLAFAFMNKRIPEGYVVDHINGNPSDNRFRNLRIATVRENAQNSHIHRSGRLPGTRKRHKKFMASIQIEGINYNLGTYDTEEEAHLAYKNACDGNLRLKRIGFKGEVNSRAKLTEEDVKYIRKLCDKENVNMSAIAREYNVTPTAIYDIKIRKRWKHI